MIKDKNFLEILPNDLNPYEKDECKILISEYLNDSTKDKKIHAKTANQLHYIIDFLIEYINNKERVFKEKMTNVVDENRQLILSLQNYEEKVRQMKDVIKNKKLDDMFSEINLNIQNDYQILDRKNIESNFDISNGEEINKNQLITSNNIYVKTTIRKGSFTNSLNKKN
jgi:hypothetical protein